MATTYLKGLRTKYWNLLEKEMAKSEHFLTEEIEEHDIAKQIRNVNTIIRRMKEFGEKLEETMKNLCTATEEKDDKEEIAKLSTDCERVFEFTNAIMERSDELFNVEKSLQDRKFTMEKEKPTDGKVEYLIQLQSRMQEQVLQFQQLQIKQMQDNEKSRETTEGTFSSVRLPKLEMLSYNGDKLRWSEFWDSFETTVHKNRKLSPIEKFNYLRSKLYGPAQSAISGLTLSNENYEIAINLLKERFGDVQSVVNSHYVQLINLTPATNQTSSLRMLYDNIERHLRSLEALSQDINQDVFISMMTSKLPKEVLIQLEIQKGSKEKWSVEKFRDLLKNYIFARESADTQSSQIENANEKRYQRHHSYEKTAFSQQNSHTSTEALMTTTKENFNKQVKYGPLKICRYCDSNHWSDECTKYKTIEERKQRIQGSCYICLRKGHKVTDCATEKNCYYCQQSKNHHSSLCPKRFQLRQREISHLIDESPPTGNTELIHEESLLSSGDIVLMQTARTLVGNTENPVNEEVRVLFDSGSQRTYITEDLAKRLNLKMKSVDEISLVTFGSEKPQVIKSHKVTLNIELKDGTLMRIDANAVPKITGPIQRRPIQTCENWRYLWRNITLADTLPIENETTTIDLLVGSDYYLDLILPEKIEVQQGLYLLGSKLGWILTGRSQNNIEENSTHNMLILNFGDRIHTEPNLYTSVDQSLPIKPLLEDFWKLESLGITDSPDISDDDKALSDFNQSLMFHNGRYEVTWPWKSEMEQLPENRALAYGRLKSLVQKLRNKPELLQKYDTVIQEQLKQGIIEKVNNDFEKSDITHYIPHHAVIDQAKATTKVRIVYDASAKTKKSDKSLNECLYRGPVLLHDLSGLLLRFRLQPVAIVADIEKAFLQLGLQEKDRNVTRFFWLKDVTNKNIDGNIQTYRFCRVPFGVIASPFLLAATVDSHLKTYPSPVAETIRNNIYVDNVITGVHGIEDAKTFYTEAKQIFKEASMNLRDWASNSKEFISNIPASDKANRENVKVLGLTWSVNEDILLVSTPLLSKLQLSKSKREVLQGVASIFDPLGYFSPVILKAKLFLQILWNKNMDWDDQLSNEDLEQWQKISLDLHEISTCQITRHIGLKDSVTYKLVCFSDASTRAFATTVYLHQSSNNMCKVDLLFSKTRLAPTKKLSLPRLELLAVLIGTRSIEFVQNHINLPLTEKFLFTDSQCVLHWIKTNRLLSAFVENRVKEIKSINDVQFKYVPTKENPADLASRGKSISDIKNNQFWWKGPSWLTEQKDKWPKWDSTEKIDAATHEYKNFKSMDEAKLLAGENPNGEKNKQDELNPPLKIDYTKFSSSTRLIRVTAWILRFIRKLRKDTINGPLTVTELENAQHKWIRFVQTQHFNEVIDAITEKRNNNLKTQLGLIIDEMGLIRCVGRLRNADMCEGAKRPILLPKTDHFTELIIDSCHRKSFHTGVSQTLAAIRQTYWIPQGRAAVKKVLQKCRNCRRYEGGPYKMPIMPPLPKKRVAESAPFTYTGVDYFGPMFIKSQDGNQKVWICLYTCLAVRAIHLELMQDMSAEQFLLGLRRFIARWGKPRQIISDNASQFKLASNTLQDLWENAIVDIDVQSYIANEGVKWQFIVERAPWMGGYYERLVGLVKRSLRKSIGKICLTCEQLRTVLTEVEAIINSRPLVYLGDDINSNITLTPAHFLTLNPKIGIPETDTDVDPEYLPEISSSGKLLSSWKKGQKHLNSFWKIWRDQYLLSLRERTATKLKTGRIHSIYSASVGDIVLLKDDLPRGSWKIGKIIGLTVSSDEQIRSAKVLLPSNKTLNRPLNLLYPIECTECYRESPNEIMKSSPTPTYGDHDTVREPRRAALEARKKIKDWTRHTEN